MIRRLKCSDMEALYRTGRSRRFVNIASVAVRKLDMLNAAGVLDDLRVPPGNRLEALEGNRQERLSIRINDRWRICSVWTKSSPADVEITDYQ
jgi:toxin HigB-1